MDPLEENLSSNEISSSEHDLPDEQPPLEPTPGPVDPNLLTEKLLKMAETGKYVLKEDVQTISSQNSDNIILRKPSGSLSREETRESIVEVLIEQEKKHFSDDSEDDRLVESSEEVILYGNVKMQLPKYSILRSKVSDKANLKHEILKTFCFKQVNEISLPTDIRMDVESCYWEQSFSCPKCPGEFNCTCHKDIKDIMIKLTNCFEIVVVPSSRCTICLQILDHLRKRKTIFCQVNIEDQESQINNELRELLETNEGSFWSGQIQHHWSHENMDENSAELLLLGENVKLPVPDYLDVIVIGTNAAALSICEEAEVCGISVGLIDVESTQASSLWGFHRTYAGCGVALKKYLLEAALVQDSIKMAPFCGLKTTEEVNLEWVHLRNNATKAMNALAWRRRVDFMNKGVLYIAGTPKLVDRNTIQVVSHQGVLTFHAKFIVYASECDLLYEHFPGLHRYCYKIHKILSYNSIDLSTTLVYGSTVTALEYGGIFRSFGHDVTIMMNSKIHPKYDSDMINQLEEHMTKNGVIFIKDCRIYSVMPVPRSSCGSSSIPSVLQKLMVIGQSVETGRFRRDYFDNVIVIPNEEPHQSAEYGFEEIGVKFCKYNPKLIEVDKNYRTSVTNIYAIGSMVPGLQDENKSFDNIGRQLIKSISSNKNLCENIDTKFHTIYTPVEYSFYGLSEKVARSLYKNVIIYHTLYEPWELALVPLELRIPCYMKLVCSREESDQKRRKEIIIGLHVVGRHAAKIVAAYATALSEGLTKDMLDNLLGLDFTCATAAITMTTIKNVDDPVLVPGGCCTGTQ